MLNRLKHWVVVIAASMLDNRTIRTWVFAHAAKRGGFVAYINNKLAEWYAETACK